MISGKRSCYYSHSPAPSGKIEYLSSHLNAVSKRASEYALPLGLKEKARIAGLLHDLGKYGFLFQKRLEGKERGIDHWSIGAWAALKEFRCAVTALAVQGHHIGLQRADGDSLKGIRPDRLIKAHPLGLRVSEPDIDLQQFLERFSNDGLTLPQTLNTLAISQNTLPIEAMLETRMLFSTLVDADFIETEAHFQSTDGVNKSYRPEGPTLQPDKALHVLQEHLQKLTKLQHVSERVLSLRADLQNACRVAASTAQGLFTLTAPTGSGKTLSMLTFALEHAIVHNLRRIIVVIPYLSIIEQTAQVYRGIFNELFGNEYILEDHSLAGTHSGNKGAGDSDDLQILRNQLAENWDAPIIVTTSVQLLESLFANRSSSCRKLHRLAGSVILFDEVQTLPKNLIVPTLASLSYLSDRFNSSVVFSTATQPAFGALDEAVTYYCNSGWKPREIVSKKVELFSRARRTKVLWPDLSRKVSWPELANKISCHNQVLCIVNLKRHACVLYDELCNLKVDGLYHLSTNMCPAHRGEILEKVRSRLRDGKSCRLVSTQCVEAGVDVDFPVVFRSLGPMDAIAQAAGRCNRNGRMEAGLVHVFIPDDEQLCPPGPYEQATSVTLVILQQYSTTPPDMDDPELFNEYYRNLFSYSAPENQNKELQEAIKVLDFPDVALKYRLIDKPSINVLVPYDIELFNQLKSEAEDAGLNRRWIARARPYSIGLYKPGKFEPYLEPVPLKYGRQRGASEDWFIYLNKDDYDKAKGLVMRSDDLLIA